MDGIEWLWEQAKIASPFVAVFCMVATGIGTRIWLRREEQWRKTVESMGRAQTRAMLAQAKSSARLSASIQRLLDRNGR